MNAVGLARKGAGLLSLLSAAVLFWVYAPALFYSLRLPLPVFTLPGLPGFSALQYHPTKDEWRLSIPKLGVEAPIVSDVNWSDPGQYDPALHTGVALAAGSADLSAGWGNSFIFGHSSSLSLSSYSHIFAALPDLSDGDLITIAGGDLPAQTYRVTISKEVSAEAVNYLADQPKKQLTLVTCYPVGTNLARWLVQAVKI